jgi:hypothetical protein
MFAGKQADMSEITVQTDGQQVHSHGTPARGLAGSSCSSSGASTYFLRMLAGSRSNSSSVRSRHSTDSAEPAICSSSIDATADVGAASQQWLEVDATISASSSTQAGPCDSSCEAVVKTAECAEPEETLAGELQPLQVNGDWLTSMQDQLQDTEAAAAALAAAAISTAAAAAIYSSSESSDALESMPVQATRVPANSEAMAAYQQQLRMLDELELLEAQVQCT